MINLHNVVRMAISAINPDQVVRIKRVIGYDNSGTYAVPVYSEVQEVQAQIQPMPSQDIQFINNYNSSSIYKTMYLNGNWTGLNRVLGTGGDVIEWDNKKWYVTSVPEDYSPTVGWTKIIVVAQIGDENE